MTCGGKENRDHLLKPHVLYSSNCQFPLKFFNFKILLIEEVIFMEEMSWITKQAKQAQQNLRERVGGCTCEPSHHFLVLDHRKIGSGTVNLYVYDFLLYLYHFSPF